MGIKWKVCGLRDNILEVVTLKPDYIGFIFYPKSPRFVGEEFEIPKLNSSIKKVGVFVNESTDPVLDKVRKYKLDFVQLHGNETPSECALLKQNGIGVIKAFAVSEGFDFRQVEPFDSVVDYFLFDTKTNSFGGSGRAFNWDILHKYNLDKHYFLSGGLSLNNIGALHNIDLQKVHALDVNSRFEVKPGLKDINLLKELYDQIVISNVNE